MLASQLLIHQQVAIDNLSDSDWNVIVDPITDSVVVTFHLSILYQCSTIPLHKPSSAPLVAREHLLYSP